jgi:hypothetical protein
MTVAEQMRREARAEDHVDGEAKGRTEGAAAAARVTLLTKLLTLKFGALAAPEYVDRLSSASNDLLDRWVERVLTAERVGDVLVE